MLYRKISSIGIFLYLALGISFSAKSQVSSDSIIAKTNFLSYKYLFRGVPISANKVLEIMKDSSDAYEDFASANEARVFAYIFGTSGVIFMALPVVMSAFGNNKAWGIAYAGAGLVLVSVPLFVKHKAQTIKALELYNQKVEINTAQRKTELHFQLTQYGLSFCLRF